jgi:methionyl-tRNA synthetase
VPCDHEYLNFKGAKLSKSRGAFVEVPYFLSKYDPDALRFYLTATAPETRDTEFSWEDFVERNNNELVATHSLSSVQAWTARHPGPDQGGQRGCGHDGIRHLARAVDNLKTILAPILPHTAQQFHECPGYV